ncbi:MAG: hypothetical protein ACRC8G_02545 [Plesiomonas shigelloides]
MHSYSYDAKPVVLADSHVVESYLEQHVGLSQVDLKLILERGLSGLYSTTINHPAISRGAYFYGEAVSAAREILAPKGFQRRSIRNIEFAVNERSAIYVCRGCEQTGLVEGRPESRYPKGEFTREFMGLIYDNYPGQGRLVLDDNQISFDLPEMDVEPILPNQLGLDLWFLLYSLDRDADSSRCTIKAELSRPASFNNKGIVNSFSTRLILNMSEPDYMSHGNDVPQFTPDIDLDILKMG